MPATGPDSSRSKRRDLDLRKRSTSIPRPRPLAADLRTPSSSRRSRSRSHSATSFPAPISHPLLNPQSVPPIWSPTDVPGHSRALVRDGHTIVSTPIDGPSYGHSTSP